jgi:hypothetical protein
MFKVQVDGTNYDEMHADGGVTTQVFGAIFLDRLIELSGHKQGRFFLIRNECPSSDWQSVKPRLGPIAGRTVDTMIKTQGIGDLYRAFAVSQAGGTDFNMASIPDSFTVKSNGQFDPAYMTALFDVGFKQARDGSAWMKQPPSYKAVLQ